MNIDERLIEDLWTLYQRLEDSEDPTIVEAANNVATAFSFDIRMLPEKMFKAVCRKKSREAVDSHFDSIVEDYESCIESD